MIREFVEFAESARRTNSGGNRSEDKADPDVFPLVSCNRYRVMSQAFGVRLLEIGPNRLPVLRRIRPLVGVAPDECRRLAEAGGYEIAVDIDRWEASALVAELKQLGASAEMYITIDDGG